MVSNIGFNKDALHTKDVNSIFSEIKTKETSKITHPDFVLTDFEADNFTLKLVIQIKIFLLERKIKF